MYDVVIVGAGASGTLCALTVKKLNKNLKVLLVDKNDKIGKKLLLTGNGRCNLGNKDLSLDNYYDSKIKLINNDYLDYLKSFGIMIKEDEGRLYPYSMQALGVCKSLEMALKKLNVELKLNYDVTNIIKDNDNYVINNNISTKYLVMATGGKSYPKTGSDGYGYKLLNNLGHNITKLYPSLTSLKTNNKYIKDVAGVRVFGDASLIVNDKFILKESGQIQFTRDSVSGICVFNLSRNVGRYLESGKNVKIVIDTIPNMNDDELKKYLSTFNSYKLESALSCILNNKLAGVIAKTVNCYGKEVVNTDLNKVINEMHNVSFNIIKTGDFDSAQVTTGGVMINEFNDYLESLKSSNLYAIGEVLDVDGMCGGYNLAWAFSSAVMVAKDIINKNN